MAAPLFGLALLWNRFDLGRRRWLGGREVGLGPFRVHTNNLVSGLMFVALGVVSIAYDGTSALAGFYESRGATEMVFAAEGWAAGLARNLPILAVPVAGAVVLAAFLAYRAISRRSVPGAETRPWPGRRSPGNRERRPERFTDQFNDLGGRSGVRIKDIFPKLVSGVLVGLGLALVAFFFLGPDGGAAINSGDPGGFDVPSRIESRGGA